MSVMSELDGELEYNWTPTTYGYQHNLYGYEIHWWNSNKDTVALMSSGLRGHQCLLPAAKLHEAVYYVTQSL